MWTKRHRLLLTWTLRSGIVLTLILAGALWLRPADEEAVLPGQMVDGLTAVLARDAGAPASPIRFRDATPESGIRFRHFPDVRASVLPEDMGSGVACGDFDNDGLVDLFFANFAGSIFKPLPEATGAPPPLGVGDGGLDASEAGSVRHGGRTLREEEASCRLYRNLGEFRFEDVTERAGVGLIAYAMGAAWGDYDGDGDLDLYVTTFGDNVLYENLGNGAFRDVTARTGVQDSRFSAGCSWADYDRDGDLDLYVCNYVDFVFRNADRDVTSRQYGAEQPYTESVGLPSAAKRVVPQQRRRNLPGGGRRRRCA